MPLGIASAGMPMLIYDKSRRFTANVLESSGGDAAALAHLVRTRGIRGQKAYLCALFQWGGALPACLQGKAQACPQLHACPHRPCPLPLPRRSNAWFDGDSGELVLADAPLPPQPW